MLYYSSVDTIDSDNYKSYDEGTCSKVYISNDIALKIYGYDVKYSSHIKKKMFNLFKNLNVPNLVKLYNFYYKYNDYLSKLLTIDAYTMEYIKDDKIKLKECDQEYIIIILKQLEETLKSLINNKILIGDSHRKNIVLNQNGITLIDLDNYYKSKHSSNKSLYRINKNRLLYTLCSSYTLTKNPSRLEKMIEYEIERDNYSLTDDFLSFLNKENSYQISKKYGLNK